MVAGPETSGLTGPLPGTQSTPAARPRLRPSPLPARPRPVASLLPAHVAPVHLLHARPWGPAGSGPDRAVSCLGGREGRCLKGLCKAIFSAREVKGQPGPAHCRYSSDRTLIHTVLPQGLACPFPRFLPRAASRRALPLTSHSVPLFSVDSGTPEGRDHGVLLLYRPESDSAPLMKRTSVSASVGQGSV